ncbi:hypothetical protein DNTS_035513 [Danionella cerebrum]|uniref:Uncharacterized protein n=1 Tax=Danionella cerebrum TaxID=2873325 RepID=A0A553RG80_9TELE|nr:hypothetical protein DNTS_035513 [Danionella translucida]
MSEDVNTVNYTGRVVGNGLQAQKHNPEIKVRSVDPILVTAKEKLESFFKELWAELDLGWFPEDMEFSGEERSGDCDDEDGCEGSGQSRSHTVQTRVRAPSQDAIIPKQVPKSKSKTDVRDSGIVLMPAISTVLFLSLWIQLLPASLGIIIIIIIITPSSSSQPLDPDTMDLAAVAVLVTLVSVSLSAENAAGKARSCTDVRHFYSGKGFTLNGVPQSEISVGHVVRNNIMVTFVDSHSSV